MKCLPREKVKDARGNVLHDWHAEILALRGFNRWVLDECLCLAGGGVSDYLRWREGWSTEAPPAREANEQHYGASYTARGHPFELRPGRAIHLYISCAPCGDASMELTMAAQDDPTPWTVPPPSAAPDDLPGRAHFDRLGIVRRKPSRPDAPGTWSKSCSDKLAMRQCTGLLSGLVAQLVRPDGVYLNSLILPRRECVPLAVGRAFGPEGRMAPLRQIEVQRAWAKNGFALRPFDVRTTSRGFAFERAPGAVASNLSTLWTAGRCEVLINGVLQGRKQLDPMGASSVARSSLWRAAVEVAVLAGLVELEGALRRSSYAGVKDLAKTGRDQVKQDAKELSLRVWKRNDGDDGWSLQPG